MSYTKEKITSYADFYVSATIFMAVTQIIEIDDFSTKKSFQAFEAEFVSSTKRCEEGLAALLREESAAIAEARHIHLAQNCALLERLCPVRS